jgi:signal transduction histidine kinase
MNADEGAVTLRPPRLLANLVGRGHRSLMRLAEFILGNTDHILREWDVFARSIWPDGEAGPLLLRDHAEAILQATARDMASIQTAPEQSKKSKGGGSDNAASATLDGVSKIHAQGRVTSGFDLMALVSEYRALRASVIRLWGESASRPHQHDLADLTRFNESIDQSLAEAVRHFSEHMDQSREMFLGILGHDLRNPLNAVLLSAQALREVADSKTADLVSQITTSGEAMTLMLADFLVFTASRLGRRIPISRTTVDLGALCREVVTECNAAYRDGALHLDVQGDLIGEWDAARVRQVISNLVGNAIEHGSEGKPVRVSTSSTESHVNFQVHNFGEPIAPEALGTIFDPLVQRPPALKKRARRAGSMGLGLYIAKEVVKAHAGSIEVRSSIEHGTIFTVRLPRS